MKKILGTCLFVLFVALGYSTTLDSLLLQTWRWNKLSYYWQPLSTWNTANNHLLPVNNYLDTRVAYEQNNRKKIGQTYQGDTSTNYVFRSVGFRRMEHATVSGNFSYNSGVHKGIEWNSTEDYLRLAPYTLTNEFAEDSYFEEYNLSGAYTQIVSNNIFGFEGSYRAYGSYGKSDPRTKSTVSDLNVSVGAIHIMDDHYWGVALSGGRYRNKNASSFYEEDRVEAFYILNGLGNYNREAFDIASGARNRYNGYNYGVSAEWLPKHVNSIWLAGRANWLVNDLKYESSRILSRSNERQLELELGYRAPKEWWLNHIEIEGFWSRKLGTEYYYEEVIVDPDRRLTDYRLLSKSQKYESNSYQFATHALFDIIEQKNALLNFQLGATYNSYSELYRLPFSELSYSDLNYSVKTNWQKRFEKSQLFVTAYIDTRMNLNSKLKVDQNLMLVQKMIVPNYELNVANRWRYGATINYQFTVEKDILLNVKLGGSQTIINNQSGNAINIACGIQF